MVPDRGAFQSEASCPTGSTNDWLRLRGSQTRKREDQSQPGWRLDRLLYADACRFAHNPRLRYAKREMKLSAQSLTHLQNPVETSWPGFISRLRLRLANVALGRGGGGLEDGRKPFSHEAASRDSNR